MSVIFSDNWRGPSSLCGGFPDVFLARSCVRVSRPAAFGIFRTGFWRPRARGSHGTQGGRFTGWGPSAVVPNDFPGRDPERLRTIVREPGGHDQQPERRYGMGSLPPVLRSVWPPVGASRALVLRRRLALSSSSTGRPPRA